MSNTARQGLLATGAKGPPCTAFAGQWNFWCTCIAVDIHGKGPSTASDSTGPERAGQGRSAGFGINAAVFLSTTAAGAERDQANVQRLSMLWRRMHSIEVVRHGVCAPANKGRNCAASVLRPRSLQSLHLIAKG